MSVFLAAVAHRFPPFTILTQWEGGDRRCAAPHNLMNLVCKIGSVLSLMLGGASAIAQLSEPVVPVAMDEQGARALRQWLPSALAGEAPGQYMLGLMQFDGRDGIPKNTQSGLAWWQLAANQGHAGAEFALGHACLRGEWVPCPIDRAVSLLERAGTHGSAKAQLQLGLLMDGVDERVVSNDAQAVYWYQLAAKQGLPEAQHLLGQMYGLGRGVEKNLSTAVAWHQRAAAQGNADAQYDFGLSYLHGDGVRRSRVLAYTWLKIAAVRGHKDAGVQADRAAAALPPEDVERVEALAVRWKPGIEVRDESGERGALSNESLAPGVAVELRRVPTSIALQVVAGAGGVSVVVGSALSGRDSTFSGQATSVEALLDDIAASAGAHSLRLPSGVWVASTACEERRPVPGVNTSAWNERVSLSFQSMSVRTLMEVMATLYGSPARESTRTATLWLSR